MYSGPVLELPSSKLSSAEALELNCLNLASEILIDVQNYKVANSQLGTDHASQTKVWYDLRIRHVQDVKSSVLGVRKSTWSSQQG